MYSYYIHYIVFQSSKSKVLVNSSDKFFDADNFQDALYQFWDYVNPITKDFYVVITYMAKEICPDTYSDPRFKFEGGK